MDDSELWAQFDKAKAKREVKYECYIHESYEPIPQDTLDYLKAYWQFINHCEETKIKFNVNAVVGHRCDATCPFVVFGDYAFCQETGNLHVCALGRCRSNRTSAGNNVCELTGKVYGMDMTLDLGVRSGLGDQFSRVVEAKPTHTKVFGPRKKRVKSKTGTTGRKVSKRTKERKVNQSIQYTGALSAIEKLFKGKTIPDKFAFRFANLCVKLYNAVLPFAEKFNRSVVYQLEYHCYVVAYYMSEAGFSSQSVRLLPSNSFLQQHIPKMGELSKLGIETAKHTQISKQFMLSIKKLTQTELTMLGDALQALWP